MPVPYELHLALRYLRFHRGRTFLSMITAISVAGVCVGTAALVIALSLMAGFVADVRERIHSGSAHLTLMSVRDTLFDDAETVIAEAEAVPGVRAAGPVLYTPAMLTLDDLRSPGFAEVHGIDPGAHVRVVVGNDDPAATFGALASPAPGGRAGIVLGEQLAARMGLIAGDHVRILVPRITLSPWGTAPRSQVFEVLGTYRSDHFDQDSQRAYVGIEALRGLLRAGEGTSWVEVRLDDLRTLEAMKPRLREALGPPWLVIDLLEQNQEILKALNTEKLTLFLAIGLIVVVASLNIVSTLILMVTDKLKEIGTLTAMGARPEGIALVFMLQGLIIGVVGTVTGLAVGVAASWWLDRYRVIELNPEVYYLTHLPFSPQSVDVVVVGISAMLISFLATIYPAVKAARLDPVEAIRHE
jgi:lipoprotein-releasing system permease protein